MVHSISATLIVGYALNFATQSFVYPLLKVRSVRLTETTTCTVDKTTSWGLTTPVYTVFLLRGQRICTDPNNFKGTGD